MRKATVLLMLYVMVFVGGCATVKDYSAMIPEKPEQYPEMCNEMKNVECYTFDEVCSMIECVCKLRKIYREESKGKGE